MFPWQLPQGGNEQAPFSPSQTDTIPHPLGWLGVGEDLPRTPSDVRHHDSLGKTALHLPQSIITGYQFSRSTHQSDPPQMYQEGPTRDATSDARHAEQPSGKLQPIRVIDTPQGLYALYDREELLEYKKTIPHGATKEEEYTHAEPTTLYPLWSGGHPPEKHALWQHPSGDMQYRQFPRFGEFHDTANDATVLVPTPRSSTLEEFDHSHNNQPYSEAPMDPRSQPPNHSYYVRPGRESPFIHQPMPLPRPQALESRFNLFASSPAPVELTNAHPHNNFARLSSVATGPNSLNQAHRYTTSVRMPGYLHQQPGNENAFASHNSAIAYAQRAGSSSGYRGRGHRRGSTRRGSQSQEPPQYRDFTQ